VPQAERNFKFRRAFAGFVVEPHHWKYSIAADYAGEPGIIKVDLV